MITDIDVATKFMSLKHSAQSRGIEFGLSLSRVRQLLNTRRCYFTRLPFEQEGPFARSIDRIDSSRGYVDDNVVACTIEINRRKSDLTLKEIECLYRGMIRKA
jgi:hypothetical protein